MNHLRFLLFLPAFLVAGFSFAGKIDTVTTRSAAMNKTIKAVVITPDSYSDKNSYPVFYLLHGFGGNYRDWPTKAPQLAQAADQYEMIIVCPDGGIGSWYLDSPVDPAWKYETYVSRELVSWIDKNYRTTASRSGRAIAGLSMGGHGALYLAFRNQDVYGAAGSLSGGVDIRPFPQNWQLSQRLGTFAKSSENWEKHTVVNMLHLLTPNSLSLLIDCGTGDFFYDVNESLHASLLKRNIPHDYITRPGVHNWDYWVNSIDFQLLFMDKFFKKSIKRQ